MDEDPEYDISVSSEHEGDDSADPLLCSAIQAALHRHHIPRAWIDVSIVSDDRIAELNQRYLGHAGPTDVLTFDLSADSEVETPGKSPQANDADRPKRRGARQPGAPSSAIPRPVEGQIVVSRDTARREAQDRGHSMQAELALYVVHGVLHLLGYDDHDEIEAERMHAIEDELLTSIGLGTVFRSIKE